MIWTWSLELNSHGSIIEHYITQEQDFIRFATNLTVLIRLTPIDIRQGINPKAYSSWYNWDILSGRWKSRNKSAKPFESILDSIIVYTV